MKANLLEGFWLPASARRHLAFVLIGVGLVLALLFGTKLCLEDVRRDVVVDLTVVNDEAFVYVNCEKAGSLSAVEEARRTIRLGWLRPDDRVTFAVFNSTGEDVVIDFQAASNNKDFGYTDGTLGASKEGPVGKFVFVRTFTAGGAPIGEAGCEHPDEVDKTFAYVPLLDASSKWSKGAARKESGTFTPDHSPDRLVDGVTVLSWVLAIVGFLLVLPFAILELRHHEWRFLPLLGGLASIVAIAPVLDSVGDRILVIGILAYVLAAARYWRRSPSSP